MGTLSNLKYDIIHNLQYVMETFDQKKKLPLILFALLGEIVCDPMCGGGSIPIEGALNWPASLHLCGDHHDLAPPRTLANVQNVVRQQQDGK